MKKKIAFLKWLDPFTYVDLLLEKLIGKQEGFVKSIVYWIFYIFTAFVSALIIYSLIGLLLGVKEPLSIVVSSSMIPNLSIGDVVIFTKPTKLIVPEIEVDFSIAQKDLKEFAKLEYYLNEHGLEEIKSIEINNQIFEIEEAITNKNSIVVYKSNINGKDIIHRAILKIKAKDGEFIITKGDNHKTNLYLDQDCGVIRDESNKIMLSKPCINLYPINMKNIQRKKIGKIPYIGYIKLVLFQ